MLNALLALAGAGAAIWAALRIRRWLKRHHDADVAESALWKPLAQYIAEHEQPPAPTRWASPKHDRGP